MKLKNIYFAAKNAEGQKKIIKSLTGASSHLLPRLTLSASRKVLMNPFSKRQVSFREVETSQEFDIPIDSELERVHLYYFKGGDKHILLTHGWADTSRSMEAIISELLALGYSVWSMDHLGHGKSSGKESNLFAFIKGLKAAIHYIETNYQELHGIIGHSAGATATLNLDRDFLAKRRIILMGVPIEFLGLMHKQMDEIGIHPKVVVDLIKYLKSEYKRDFSELDPKEHKDKVGEHFLFIHDEEDEYAPYSDLEAYAADTTSQVMLTEGLGHRKILRDEKVMTRMMEFMSE